MWLWVIAWLTQRLKSMFLNIFSLLPSVGPFEVALFCSNKCQKTLILTFEANSALSRQIAHFCRLFLWKVISRIFCPLFHILENYAVPLFSLLGNLPINPSIRDGGACEARSFFGCKNSLKRKPSHFWTIRKCINLCWLFWPKAKTDWLIQRN